MEFVLEDYVLDEHRCGSLGNLVMAFEHKVKQSRNNLIESGFFHLLTAYRKDLSPFRVPGVFHPQIVDLAVRNNIITSLDSLTVDSLINSILLNLIDLLNTVVHHTHVLQNFNDDFIQIDVEDLFHFLLVIVAKSQLFLVLILDLQILIHSLLGRAFHDLKEHVYAEDVYCFDVGFDHLVDCHWNEDAKHFFQFFDVIVAVYV